MRRSKLTVNRFLVLLLTLTSLGSLATAGYLMSAPPTYTINDSGTAIPITGNYESIDELLGAADVIIRAEDVVVFNATDQLDPDVPVVIRRARPVTLRTEEGTRTLWTLKTTLGEFLREAGVDVQQREQIYADGALVTAGRLAQAPLPETVEIGRFVTITVIDGRQRQILHTTAETVAEALQEARVSLEPEDGVVPDENTPVANEMTITIRRAIPLTIQVDGQLLQVESFQTNPVNVLAEEGITLSPADKLIPGANTVLKAHDVIQVVRVTEDFRTEDETIPYQTLWQATAELPLDSQAIINTGVPGIRRRRIRVRYEDGVEVSQTTDGEWIAREPVDEIIGYGTRIELGTVETPEGPREYWRVVRMRATSYTAASSGKAPGDPDYGRTASGVPAGYGVVAVDRSIVPFLSYVYVPGYGIGYVGDTGGGIRGRWIDLGYDEDNFVSWSGYVDVYYLTPVPTPEDINYLLPSILP